MYYEFVKFFKFFDTMVLGIYKFILIELRCSNYIKIVLTQKYLLWFLYEFIIL